MLETYTRDTGRVPADDRREVIWEYCGDIEARVQACHSRRVAQLLKENICLQFRSQCKSEMVAAYLEKHVDEVIERNFPVA